MDPSSSQNFVQMLREMQGLRITDQIEEIGCRKNWLGERPPKDWFGERPIEGEVGEIWVGEKPIEREIGSRKTYGPKDWFGERPPPKRWCGESSEHTPVYIPPECMGEFPSPSQSQSQYKRNFHGRKVFQSRSNRNFHFYESDESEDDHYLVTTADPNEPIGYHNRFHRAFQAINFRNQYKFVQGHKYCISSNSICSWSDKCLDSTWVAVQGMESVCMVTRQQDAEDMTRVDPFYLRYCTNRQTMRCQPTVFLTPNQLTMRSYVQSVISEVECLPYDDDFSKRFGNNFRERFGQSIEKPFGVVSVVPDSKEVDEESGHQQASGSARYDEEKAIAFLKKKMNSGLAFTVNETIQTAISVYQHLCVEELKAEDIWVTSIHFAKNIVKHLYLSQRKEHLAVISGVSSGVSEDSFNRGLNGIIGTVTIIEPSQCFYHKEKCNCCFVKIGEVGSQVPIKSLE